MARRPRWLTDDEQATWRSYLLTTQLLDEALDRQLQRDAGFPHAYYGILVTLSEAPQRSLRMSELARRLRYSQSRMTHAVTSLERSGWVRREACPSDRRGQLAVLTPAGMDALKAAAPGHVAEVRARLFDRLTPTQQAQLRDICDTVLAGLDTNEDAAPSS
ncbi:MAG: MarR family transcriptional repressor [Actinomycetia bacterium]|jgi:DNA-binding MarR family transcriptional regulator|nr:MarR family transcriptional repressor [Actinomycetes bacterium]